MSPLLPGSRRANLVGILLALCGTWCGWPAKAQLTSESPEVKQCIARAIGFLESGAATDARLGAYALAGMTLIKNDAPPNHPKVVEAVQQIQQVLKGGATPASFGDNGIYSIGMSTIFLCTLDPDKYRAEITALLQTLQAAQKPHGGWGYLQKPTGDTSMTQYGVLSIWEARQVGFDVPTSMIERVADWLLRTQDPSGAYGYQGIVSNSDTLVPQKEVREGVGIAGLGSLYICANMLGMDERAMAEEKARKLPAALKEVQEKDARRSLRSRLDLRLFQEAKSRGNRWFQQNFRVDPPLFPFYYLYAVERYWSVREYVEGNDSPSPSWYQDAARWLMKTQNDDGSWVDKGTVATAGAVPDTAFGALFLLRSMRKSIERAKGFGRGTLVGGRGLPKGVTDVVLRQGQIVAKPLSGPAEQLMAAIENAESPERAGAAEAMADISIADARKLVSTHEGKLRQLVSGGSIEARLAAVQALARSYDLDNVPTLIYALTDSDPLVILAARDGLRRMSGTFDTFGPPDQFTEEDVWRAVREWKQWYRTIRPDAEFED